MFRAERGGLA